MTSTWPMEWPVDTTNLDAEKKVMAELNAESVLRMLTLQRVGGGAVTVRPCGRSCGIRQYGYIAGPGFHPYLTETGQYANCFCNAGCDCDDSGSIWLHPPVGEIIEVSIDGTTLAAENYSVVNGTDLVRTDGRQWPSCSKTFLVTYRQGYPIDQLGQFAGGVLAHEFYKASINDNKCRLPSNVTSISRAGVSMQMSTGLFPDGLTGIREVDAFVRQWNPNGLKARPSVWSPDLDTGTVV